MKERVGLKILAVSNFYPPYFIGGYELGCRDVMSGLKARGHEIRILTSTYGVAGEQDDGEVWRWLHSSYDVDESPIRYALKLIHKGRHNQQRFRRAIALFKPDIIYAWNLALLAFPWMLTTQRLDMPVCYYISDGWLAHWESTDTWVQWSSNRPSHPIKRVAHLMLMKSLARSAPTRQDFETLDLSHTQFTSDFLKNQALSAGQPVANGQVIHWGIDVKQFSYRPAQPQDDYPTRLLYVGQLMPHKGVHTVIEAVALLLKQNRYSKVTLTIAGGTSDPTYKDSLEARAQAAGLENNVRFLGQLSREQLPRIYQEHDVLLFPSIWDEPFSITVLEALSSGLAVIGTATGGSGEILKHEVNALLFPAGDAAACAVAIERLLTEPGLFAILRLHGRQTVEEKFRLEQMLDKVERSLQAAIQAKVVDVV